MACIKIVMKSVVDKIVMKVVMPSMAAEMVFLVGMLKDYQMSNIVKTCCYLSVLEWNFRCVKRLQNVEYC
jgi:hypothetical protein